MRLFYLTVTKAANWNHRNTEYVVVFIACILHFFKIYFGGGSGGVAKEEVAVNVATLISSLLERYLILPSV